MKESHARRKKRQPIPKRVSGDGSAPPRFLVAVNFAFGRLAFATRPFCSVTSPLPKKSLLCKSFSGALFHSVFRVVLVVFFVACAWLRRREAPTHLSMPSTRHGAKSTFQYTLIENDQIFMCKLA